MTEVVAHVRNLPEIQREHAVTAYLASARDRLADARAAKGPEAVARLRAEVSTVAEMTKQLNLSRECREEATEIERRCEFDLGVVIRRGQADGTIRTNGQIATDKNPSSLGVKEIEPQFYNNSAKGDPLAERDVIAEAEALTEAAS